MRTITRLPIALALALVGCTSTPRVAPPPLPVMAVPEPAPALPGAEVWLRAEGASRVVVDWSERVELTGPIATSTLALILRNPDPGVDEAQLGLRLPAGAVVGRLALDVDGRWMEGEVMPRAAATRFYEGIVRPSVGARRDPALLVGRGDREWSLDVFPIPGEGERHVELVYHRLIGAAPGTVRLEALPPSLAATGSVFAAVPRFDREDAGPVPATVVIALDTSLSLGKAGLLESIAVARRVLAARPDARLVTGDLHPRACTASVEDCLAGLDAGGATDLTALLTEAFRVAGGGPAAVVLISDGRPTIGGDPEALRRLVEQRVAAAPVAVHTFATGRARPRVLDHLADVGLGTAAGELERALTSRRRPRYEVRGAEGLEVVSTPRGPVVLGRLTALPPQLEVIRTDDAGSSRARLALDATVARGFGVARVLGARAVARADADAAQLARDWGIATEQAAMLALENDDDYEVRGIARYKAAERAAELGLPPPSIPDAVKASDRALVADGDGDGLADAVDRCPADPETFNGLDDEDGCPDRARVIIESQRLEILDRVFFDPGRALVQRRALPLLDEVAAVMRDHPELSVVAIEGHRDPRESARGGLGLRRAEAVRHALIRRGVEPARLVAVDLGDRYPLRAGRTADERAYNRRIEWRILVVDGELIEPRGGLLAEEARALAATGRASWRLEAAVTRAELARRDRPAAAAALARARAATTDLGQQLAIFSPDVAAAWPAEYVALVRDAARAGVEPADADADRFFAALTKSGSTDPDGPALRAAAERWLARLSDPDVRRTTTTARLAVSADLLDWLLRPEEAVRRRSEVIEVTAER